MRKIIFVLLALLLTLAGCGKEALPETSSVPSEDTHITSPTEEKTEQSTVPSSEPAKTTEAPEETAVSKAESGTSDSSVWRAILYRLRGRSDRQGRICGHCRLCSKLFGSPDTKQPRSLVLHRKRRISVYRCRHHLRKRNVVLRCGAHQRQLRIKRNNQREKTSLPMRWSLFSFKKGKNHHDKEKA